MVATKVEIFLVRLVYFLHANLYTMSLTTNELAKDLIYDIVRDFHGRVTSVSKLFQEVNSRLVVNGYGSIGWPTFQRLLKSDRRIAVVANGVIRKMVVLKEKIIPTSKTPLEIRDYEDGGLEWPIRTTLYHYRYVGFGHS